ncbi:hypothetical protein [Methylobacterium sp. MA0201]|uniref:hypothetical protein n=1 Tax=Methylobacterium alsaeris TaxID=3344826 RepID=UPI0037565D99
MVAVEDDELAGLQDRLHAARKALGEAYDRRDARAEEIAAAEAVVGGVVRPELLVAFSAAERAVLAAEAEMKDAEYALAVATEGVVSAPRRTMG